MSSKNPNVDFLQPNTSSKIGELELMVALCEFHKNQGEF